MKVKLVKTVTDNYILVDPTKEFYGEGYVLGTTVVSDAPRLSLKNCEAIQRGYDLDELFNKVDESIDYHEFDFTSFRLGFQKVLELMGDKEFSELDMENCWKSARQGGLDGTDVYEDTFEKYIKSIQQTDWDVEIETFQYGIGNDADGRPVIEIRPKLDADGCLILKRV